MPSDRTIPALPFGQPCLFGQRCLFGSRSLLTGAALAMLASLHALPLAAAPPEQGPPRDHPEARTSPPSAERQHAEQARREGPSPSGAERERDAVTPHPEAQNRVTAQREQNQQDAARRTRDEGRKSPEGEREGDRPRPSPEAQRNRPPPAPKPAEGPRESEYRDSRGKDFRVPTSDRVRVITQAHAPAARTPSLTGAALTGCPAGIADKYQGCTIPARTHPPEKAWHDPGWFARDFADDTRYRYADGYLLRLGAESHAEGGGTDVGNGVVGYIPLLGGALSVGRAWPGTYRPVALPGYYTGYYGLGGDGAYRFYDNAIYRVNAADAAITGIAALLLGNDIAIGRTMPAGYDVYNLPTAYRDEYRDGPDALYRYSDGYIYQLDPATRLVRAAIELLA